MAKKKQEFWDVVEAKAVKARARARRSTVKKIEAGAFTRMPPPGQVRPFWAWVEGGGAPHSGSIADVGVSTWFWVTRGRLGDVMLVRVAPAMSKEGVAHSQAHSLFGEKITWPTETWAWAGPVFPPA